MRSSSPSRLLSIAVTVALGGAVLAAPAVADPLGPTPTVVLPTETAPEACPHAVNPPPPVDDSETVAPGQTTPTPLVVQDPPIGGDRLGECGIVADPAAGPTPADLTSLGWLIADLDSGAVIAAQDPHGRYRPASTIKVLLALVALEQLDLAAPVTATVNDWSMEGDACGVGPGGQYTVRDILTGLLVVSGNDCANMLARELGGYDEALAKMNAKAKELGVLDTRAASPSGLDAAGMSTSPYDLAVIFRAAMADENFAEMIGLSSYKFPGYPARKDVPGDEDHPAYLMGTSNTLLRDGVPGMTVLGGKTGYTDDALKTFVGAVEQDGRTLLIVQMAGLSEGGNSYHDQAVRMLDYGFAADGSISVGTLDTGVADSSSGESGQQPWASSGTDAAALGPLELVLVAVLGLTAASLVVLAVRRHRRRR
ncbi:serine hydrolase [Gordonia phosphorivorans]|uniref:Serine hydrolase n=1 Tax=Gordonia phosphorivorans TaxID=1056982 RepID=A0ABV6HA45_9ACTN